MEILQLFQVFIFFEISHKLNIYVLNHINDHFKNPYNKRSSTNSYSFPFKPIFLNIAIAIAI